MQNIDEVENWDDLLGVLTEEELARYGEIARDQVRIEWRYWGWQIVLLAGALGLAGAGAAMLALGWGYTGAAAMVGLAGALGYWPYQKARMRRFWKGHERVVEAELGVRRSRPAGGDETGTRF